MNAAIMLVDAVNDFLNTVLQAHREQESGSVLRFEQLLRLLFLESKLIGLRALVAHHYGTLPLEITAWSDDCTQTGIRITKDGDDYKMDGVPQWSMRMMALREAAGAIAEALAAERARPSEKPNRSKYRALFPLMDTLVAGGTTVRAAALQVMEGNPKAAQSFARLWQRRNKAAHEPAANEPRPSSEPSVTELRTSSEPSVTEPRTSNEPAANEPRINGEPAANEPRILENLIKQVAVNSLRKRREHNRNETQPDGDHVETEL